MFLVWYAVGRFQSYLVARRRMSTTRIALNICLLYTSLGENGAGKSTLIKVLGGIYIAEEGEIFIDGKKVTIDGVNASHNNGISIIHQELVLVPHMTVAENIFLGREPSKGLWVSHETMEKEAQQLLEDVYKRQDSFYGLCGKPDSG